MFDERRAESEMHPQGTIKAPASPHTIRRVERTGEGVQSLHLDISIK